MAMTKDGYQPAITGTATITLATTTGGYIALDGDTITGELKTINFNGVRAENTAAQNMAVVNVFFGEIISAASVVNKSAKVNWSV